MTDQEVQNLALAFARMEAKFDAQLAGLKEDVESLKSTNQWLLRSIGAALISVAIGALVGALVLTSGAQL